MILPTQAQLGLIDCYFTTLLMCVHACVLACVRKRKVLARMSMDEDLIKIKLNKKETTNDGLVVSHLSLRVPTSSEKNKH